MLGEQKIPSRRRPSAKKMSGFAFGDAIKGSFKNIFLLMMAKGGGGEREEKAHSSFSSIFHHLPLLTPPSSSSSLQAGKAEWIKRDHLLPSYFQQPPACIYKAPRKTLEVIFSTSQRVKGLPIYSLAAPHIQSSDPINKCTSLICA